MKENKPIGENFACTALKTAEDENEDKKDLQLFRNPQQFEKFYHVVRGFDIGLRKLVPQLFDIRFELFRHGLAVALRQFVKDHPGMSLLL
jgi:hypothetical protein